MQIGASSSAISSRYSCQLRDNARGGGFVLANRPGGLVLHRLGGGLAAPTARTGACGPEPGRRRATRLRRRADIRLGTIRRPTFEACASAGSIKRSQTLRIPKKEDPDLSEVSIS